MFYPSSLKRNHRNDVAKLRAIWSLDSGDIWGECMAMHFAICEELHRRGCVIPDAWLFRPSPMLKRGGKVDADQWPDSEIAALKLHPDALRYFGWAMFRLAGYLRFKGEDY